MELPVFKEGADTESEEEDDAEGDSGLAEALALAVVEDSALLRAEEAAEARAAAPAADNSGADNSGDDSSTRGYSSEL
eukprot:923548-Pleurochrysis_carterae.AAC.1